MTYFIALTDGYNHTVYVNPDLIRSVKDVDGGALLCFDKNHTLAVKERAQTVVEIIQKQAKLAWAEAS